MSTFPPPSMLLSDSDVRDTTLKHLDNSLAYSTTGTDSLIALVVATKRFDVSSPRFVCLCGGIYAEIAVVVAFSVRFDENFSLSILRRRTGE